MLCVTFCFAQENDLEKSFSKMSLNEKIDHFQTLHDSQIIPNRYFLETSFDSHRDEQITGKQSLELQLIFSRLERFKGDYIKSVNMMKGLLESDTIVISKTDSVRIYSELRNTYYRLYLYPEIFDINSRIDKLLESGAGMPLWDFDYNSKLYAELKQFDRAAVEMKKGIERLYTIEHRDSLIIPSAYNSLGFYFLQSKQLDSAYKYFKKSIALSEKLRNTNNVYNELITIARGNIAEIYFFREDYERAIPFLEEEVELGLADGEFSSTISSTIKSLNLLTMCYLETNDFKSARASLDRTSRIIKINGQEKERITYYQHKAEYFDKMKRGDSAYYYYNLAFKIKDSLDASGMNSILASNELIYDITEERKQIEEGKVDLKNKQLELKSTQNYLYLFAAILMALLLLISMYNSYRLRKSRKEVQKKNQEIIVKNEMINNALSDKDVLLKEVHHRVKNNLQIISGLLELQNISIKDERIKMALKEGQNRIQSVALIHKMMYQSDNVSKVNMKDYLNDLSDVLKSSFADISRNVDTVVNADKISFDITTAVPVSLIVNEAVCNAYKHAFQDQQKGEITLVLEENQNDSYTLTVTDNGIGLPDTYDVNATNSIGVDLMRGLSKQLKGSFNMYSDNGTVIELNFKPI